MPRREKHKASTDNQHKTGCLHNENKKRTNLVEQRHVAVLMLLNKLLRGNEADARKPCRRRGVGEQSRLAAAWTALKTRPARQPAMRALSRLRQACYLLNTCTLARPFSTVCTARPAGKNKNALCGLRAVHVHRRCGKCRRRLLHGRVHRQHPLSKTTALLLLRST